MKKFFTGILTGIFLSSAVYFYSLKETDKQLKDVKVTQVSGEKIEHDSFNYKGNSIKFNTKSEGKGEIITEIPKTNIPEAKAWVQNTNAVMLELILIDCRIYGLSYLKRKDNFSIGGGILFSDKKFEGIKIQSLYWFNL